VKHDDHPGIRPLSILGKEPYNMGVKLELENVGNKVVHEQFQLAPTRGRSLTLSLNFRFF